jgi:hypothetical protein
MAKLKLSLDDEGRGIVSIDGHDIGDLVANISISAAAGEGVEVFIRLLPIAIEADMEIGEVKYAET